MKRMMVFSKRNFIEMSRDVLSYIFCVAFPIAMLVIMSVVNSSIPKQAGVTMFRIDNLAGGIAVFGQTFVMLFTAIGVAKDKNGSFLTRLYATPMKARDFVYGYIIPMLLVAFIQVIMSNVTAFIISRVQGSELKISGLLLSTVMVLPSALMFSAIGMIFGTLFNEKAAPGICSIIISLGCFIGGIWFDIEGVGGTIEKVAKCLPFLYATKVARAAIDVDFKKENFMIPMAVVLITALVLTVLASFVFSRKMKKIV